MEGEGGMAARPHRQWLSSRNFSASKAAMQPAPAEVIAWR
jgi:hypothetical protein